MRKAFLLFIAIALLGAYESYLLLKQPTPFAYKAVDIPAKTSLGGIARLLKQEGVLDNTWTLRILAKVTGSARNVKSGEFMFRTPSSPLDALKTLREGKVVLHKVTVPEGSSIAEMAPWFEAATVVPSQEFLDSSRNPEFLTQFQIPSDRMEGYLFPSTYFFPKNEKVLTVFKMMIGELEKQLNADDRQKSAALGWSLHQWITFASMIEKETGNPTEYALVSSVFHNRLKKGMKLQSDPTVIYGIPNYDGNIRKKDLTTDTPYNTYTRRGLPIGPISNPGAAAIHAAVNPAQTDYLYFVGNREGSHIFTKTYEEHNKAVRTYQLSR